MFYEEMIKKPIFQEEKRLILDVEVMAGSYFDGKLVDTLHLPNNCIIINIHRDRKDFPPAGQTSRWLVWQISISPNKKGV